MKSGVKDEAAMATDREETQLVKSMKYLSSKKLQWV